VNDKLHLALEVWGAVSAALSFVAYVLPQSSRFAQLCARWGADMKDIRSRVAVKE
jgi:hypothetical protein